jgi:serine/threonine protein kinase
MLCALSYLHAQSPPIIHGNLTCDSVFIAHNGLIKIGAVAPDAIRQTVKSICINGLNNLHTLAPELIGESCAPVPSTVGTSLGTLCPPSALCSGQTCPATDIYAFGVVALEMALLGFASVATSTNRSIESERIASSPSSSPGPSSAAHASVSPPLPGQSVWSRESLISMLQQLELPSQRQFISDCLAADPTARPSARSLLFHPLVFQVPSLQLLCAHRLVSSDSPFAAPETLAEELQKRRRSPSDSVASIPCMNGRLRSITPSDLGRCNSEHVEQLVEEVRDGVHPMYAFEKRKLLRTCSSQLLDVTLSQDRGMKRADDRGVDFTAPNSTCSNELLSRFDSLRSDGSCVTFYGASADRHLSTELPVDSRLFDSADSLPSRLDSCSRCAEPMMYNGESRRIVAVEVLVQHASALPNTHSQPMLSIRLRLDDQMNRQLSCELSELDSPLTMTEELVYYGFVHPVSSRHFSPLIAIPI